MIQKRHNFTIDIGKLMKTTFEVQPKILGINEKLILENLYMLENIWNVTIDSSSISFEYMIWADLEAVRRELHELGYYIINDTHQFDNSEEPF